MKPRRGEVWTVDLDPVIGSEQAGKRPALIVSVDPLNHSGAELVIVLPLTSRAKGIRSHVEIPQAEAGLELTSFAKCEDLRSISTRRLKRRLGKVEPETLRAVEDVLRILLGL